MKYKPYVEAYTDGSFSGKSNCGGWCTYLMCNGKATSVSDSCYNTTNGRMEVMAVYATLHVLDIPCKVHIFCDSQYVVKAIDERWVYNWNRNNWKTSSGSAVKHQDLWSGILDKLAYHEVSIQWVKGHSNNVGNNYVDTIAQYRMRNHFGLKNIA